MADFKQQFRGQGPCRGKHMTGHGGDGWMVNAVQVFGVTLDPFIVYTSNMFAILSLRGLYGFVSGVMGQVGTCCKTGCWLNTPMVDMCSTV